MQQNGALWYEWLLNPPDGGLKKMMQTDGC
jgi:hypothetical protein